MVLQITLRFVPILAQTAERIAKAQASRGAEWGGKTKGLINRIKQILPLLIPLFVISLRRSESLALAMDARAYGYLDYRTSIAEMKFTVTDWAFVLLNFNSLTHSDLCVRLLTGKRKNYRSAPFFLPIENSQ